MKRLIAIIMTLFLCLSVFGEGKQEGTTGGDVKLRFSWWGGEERHEATLNAIALYEEQNPGVSIEAEYGGWDGYYQKLVTQLAGQTAADIIQIDQPWMFELSSKGEIFKSLDGDTNLDLSGFDKDFLQDFCSYDGHLKGLPTGLNGQAFFLDRDVLTQAGIDPDLKVTWENIVSEGMKVNQHDSGMYFINLGPDVLTFFLEIYLAQEAGSVVNNDKSLGFTEEEATAAFTYFKSWIDKKIIPPLSEIVLYNRKGQENPDWLNSKMAGMLTWTSNLDQMRGAKTNTYITALPVMKGTSNSGIMVRPSQIMTINNKSDYPQESVKFLNYFFNNPEGTAALGTARGIPSTTAARTLLKEKGMLDPQAEEGTNIALSVLGKPQTIWQMNSEVHQIMDDVMEEFAFGELTPREASRKLISLMEEKLATL